MRAFAKIGALAALAMGLSGCMTVGQSGRDLLPEETSLAYFPKTTQTQNLLKQLPGPQRQVAIAVYGFTDQTGQFRPTNTGQTLSRAVTQGAGSILVKALQDAGNLKPGTICSPFMANSPLWSLSYELVFYAIYPLLLPLFLRAPKRVSHGIGFATLVLIALYAFAPSHFFLL